ncbi:MAG TPA: hypothetical protein VJ110_03455 [Candidatus Nanoarchaeia archaeon]|nr:hypothetical protein [Candidatus Nanoarchaeia archaeon]
MVNANLDLVKLVSPELNGDDPKQAFEKLKQILLEDKVAPIIARIAQRTETVFQSPYLDNVTKELGDTEKAKKYVAYENVVNALYESLIQRKDRKRGEGSLTQTEGVEIMAEAMQMVKHYLGDKYGEFVGD